MKFWHIFILISFLTMACGGGEQDALKTKVDTLEYLKRISKIQEKIKIAEKDAEQKHLERQKKGDTVAMTTQDLKIYLPAEILGYQRDGKLISTPYQLSGQAFSNVEQYYKKGENHLHINLVDNNGKTSADAGMFALWRENRFSENNSEIIENVLINQIKAWIYFHKQKRRTELTLAVSDRFSVYIIADNQRDTQLIKEVAEALKLKPLRQK